MKSSAVSLAGLGCWVIDRPRARQTPIARSLVAFDQPSWSHTGQIDQPFIPAPYPPSAIRTRYRPYSVFRYGCASARAPRRVDPALPRGDLLRAADLEALPLLDRAHEVPGVEQAGVRAGVEPGEAAPHALDA